MEQEVVINRVKTTNLGAPLPASLSLIMVPKELDLGKAKDAIETFEIAIVLPRKLMSSQVG